VETFQETNIAHGKPVVEVLATLHSLGNDEDEQGTYIERSKNINTPPNKNSPPRQDRVLALFDHTYAYSMELVYNPPPVQKIAPTSTEIKRLVSTSSLPCWHAQFLTLHV
jgi:hypothetical protein